MEKWQLNLQWKLDTFIEEGRTFTLVTSQSSADIKDHNNPTAKHFYTCSKSGFKLIHTRNRVKKHILENVPRGTLSARNQDCLYNYSSQRFTLYNDKEKIYGVDVSACYISIAYNVGMISKEIYNEAMNLDKDLRLKLMGLLAYKPQVFIYENGILKKAFIRKGGDFDYKYEDGVIVKFENEDIDFSEHFFYLVKKTDEIFLQLMKKLEYDSVFFWVDCIFFRGMHNIKIVQDFLKSKKLKSKCFRCFNFEKNRLDDHDYFRYTKYSPEKDIKEYNVSILNSHEKQRKNEILTAILNNDFRKFVEILKRK